MTSDTDRIEELARAIMLPPESFFANKAWRNEQAAFLRSLSAELTELRQAKESLDWILSHGTLFESWINYYTQDVPPYLKSRLEGKK